MYYYYFSHKSLHLISCYILILLIIWFGCGSNKFRWKEKHVEAGTAHDEQLLCWCVCLNSAQVEQAERGKRGGGREGDDEEERG